MVAIGCPLYLNTFVLESYEPIKISLLKSLKGLDFLVIFTPIKLLLTNKLSEPFFKTFSLTWLFK